MVDSVPPRMWLLIIRDALLLLNCVSGAFTYLEFDGGDLILSLSGIWHTLTPLVENSVDDDELSAFGKKLNIH